ncbi:hypothetical protein ACLOJK_037747, partial [Asimina triloba]
MAAKETERTPIDTTHQIRGSTRSNARTEEKTKMEQEGEEDERLLRRWAMLDDWVETIREKSDPASQRKERL